MAGCDYYVPKIEECIQGKYGTYRLIEEIGHGGNGKVFLIDIIDQQGDISDDAQYVVKILSVPNLSSDKQEKRKLRFQKEIDFVMKYYKQIKGIIPVYDSFLNNPNANDNCYWYLMPKCDKYQYHEKPCQIRLEEMQVVGKTIRELHRRGIAHRDIKPSNLLLYRNQVCLTDFGLLWNEHDQDSLTGAKEVIGPNLISPPETGKTELIEGYSYYAFDVYLFAKTVWIILTGNSRGFHEEYRREVDDIYLKKDILKIGATLEPLHQMMEQATLHEYGKRIDVNKCLSYIEKQLEIANNKCSQEEINEFAYLESVKELQNKTEPDSNVYENSDIIFQILQSLKGKIQLIVDEFGETYDLGVMNSIEIIENQLFIFKVQSFPGDRRTIKKIGFGIKSLIIDKEYNCRFITTKKVRSPMRAVVLSKLSEAVHCKETEFFIEGAFTVDLKRRM